MSRVVYNCKQSTAGFNPARLLTADNVIEFTGTVYAQKPCESEVAFHDGVIWVEWLADSFGLVMFINTRVLVILKLFYVLPLCLALLMNRMLLRSRRQSQKGKLNSRVRLIYSAAACSTTTFLVSPSSKHHGR